MASKGPRRQLSPREVKDLLSEEEFGAAKEKIERAERTLDEVKSVLSGALFLRNGKLSTGTIDYAAFRIETLSLIFEVAARTLRRTARSGAKAYEEFLQDLGDEVGFTFARGLLNRVKSRGFLLDVQSVEKLIELWALFENDTGAGETKLASCEAEAIVVQLRNNPLRRIESSAHAHCGFYTHYIMSFLNELCTSRARLIQQAINRIEAKAWKVVRVIHESDADDNCVFRATLRREILGHAFDTLCTAYDQYYRLSEQDDFSICAPIMRNALVYAQEGTVRLAEERALRQLYKVFRVVLSRRDFNRMRDVYHTLSSVVHTDAKLAKADCWKILRDTRRSIYALELLDITEEERADLLKAATLEERVGLLRDLVDETAGLSPEERRETLRLISRLTKKELVEEGEQARLLEFLKRLGGQIWELGKEILAEVAVAAIKKQYGLL